MGLNKQYTVSEKLWQFFVSIYETRTQRAGLSRDADLYYCSPAEGWVLEGWVNGPVTFVRMENNAGQEFTGWSKFDYEGQWNEQNGICRALQKAVEAYISYQYDCITAELQDSKWGTGEVMDLPVTLEDKPNAVQVDVCSAFSDQECQAS